MNKNPVPNEAKLLEQFRFMAVKIAHSYYEKNPALDKDELKAEAMMAALIAIRSHQPERAKLSTWIYNSIHFDLMEYTTGLNHVSRPHWRRMLRGQVPMIRTVSIDKKIQNNNKDETYKNTLCAKDETSQTEAEDEINTLLRRINHRDAQIIQRHYIEGERLEHVGRALGISKARASQLGKRAMCELRKASLQLR